MGCVLDFVKMQRFEDPLLVEVLEAMRTPNGKFISEAARQALKGTVIKCCASQLASTAVGSDGIDPRLADALNWHECAYEWRIVSYAMQAHATQCQSCVPDLVLHPCH